MSDFVNRGAAFDDIYVFPPLLEACCLSASIPRDTHGTSSRTTGRRLGAILDPRHNTVAFAAAVAWLALMAALVVGDDVEGATSRMWFSDRFSSESSVNVDRQRNGAA